MNLKYAVAIVLGLPIVVYGDSLRGTQEKDEVVDQKDDAADLEDRRILKKTGAQKRQEKRDYRRQYENPYRKQWEESAEQQRKYDQAMRRGIPEADPNNRDYGARLFIEGREINRYADCEARGVGCEYITDLKTYNRLVHREIARVERRARRCEKKCSTGKCVDACLDDLETYDRRYDLDFDSDLSYGLDTYDYDPLESRANQLDYDYYDDSSDDFYDDSSDDFYDEDRYWDD